jgi:glycine C-acetyltransferase
LEDLADLVAWYGDRASEVGSTVCSLPGPDFDTPSGRLVSFSTNNYLAIALCVRMKAAAKEAIEQYGVANCESRLLSGNLGIYSALEDRLAKSKGLPKALLFATGYRANLGTLSTLPRAEIYARAWDTVRRRRRATLTSATNGTTSASRRVSAPRAQRD